jgi:hypothetical protein
MDATANIRYAQRVGTTPETELGALANVYRFALNCHARKEATHPGSPDDGTKIKEDSANEHRST